MHTRVAAIRLFTFILIGAGLLGPSWVCAQDAAKTAPAAAEAKPAAAEAQPAAAEAKPAAPAPSPEQVRRGLDLFQGTARFSAGGPACNACHNVVNDAVIGGGNLAIDLTESFGRLDADGIVEVLPRQGAASPFPVMQAAFQDRDVTAEEAQSLVAFLRHAHEQRATQKPNDLGTKMLIAGVVGVIVLLLLFSFTGRGRKRRSVNQDIYDRQVTSE